MSTDGVGVRALLGVAEKLHELTGERGITLGFIEAEALGGESAVAVVMAQADVGKRGDTLVVTIEASPRLIRMARDEPVGVDLTHEYRPEAVVHSFGGHFWQRTRDCMCTNSCCNNADGDCICPECEDDDHEHPRRG